MKKRKFAGSTVGLVSIIAIVVILILAIFASLSMVTARNDRELSIRMNEDYMSRYEADYRAMEIRNNLYMAIQENNFEKRAADMGVNLSNINGQTHIKYDIIISKKHKLAVELALDGKNLAVIEWDIVYTDKRDIEDTY
jgi:hypothetical protein